MSKAVEKQVHELEREGKQQAHLRCAAWRSSLECKRVVPSHVWWDAIW